MILSLRSFRDPLPFLLFEPGQEIDLPSLTFRVKPTPLSRTVSLRLHWTVAGQPTETRAFLVNVFPTVPRWALQESPTNLPLSSVKAVTREVAWAAGGDQAGTSPVVLRTTDAGESWQSATGTLAGAGLYCISAVNADRAWVGSADGRIFATGDGGVSWAEQVYPDPKSVFINGVWFLDPLNGFAQGDPPAGSSRFVLLRTSDGGSSWTHVPNEPVGASGEYGWNNSFWWTDLQHGWFGTNNSRIWRTSDGGTTWDAAPSGGTSSFGVSFVDNLTGFAAHGDGTAARSTDGGLSWLNGSVAAGVGLVAASAVLGGTRAWVSSVATPFQTEDLGTTWEGQATYPLAGDIAHLSFVAEDRGWAVTGAGEILRFDPDISTYAESPGGNIEPGFFSLEQNYPNPFNPTTTIRFELPSEARVRVAVIDLLGRAVRTLLDENRVAGLHTVVFDASGLASGVYFYSLVAQPRAGGAATVRTRPMVLAR